MNVLRLTLHVFRAHVHNTFKTITGRNCSSGHTVLTRAGFSNHPRLAHAACEQGLTNGVVDFVRAGVIQIFALQINLRAA